MKAQLVKPVKHGLSSCSSVFTPISPISKTEILSGKYPVKFYQIPVSGSGTSLLVTYKFKPHTKFTVVYNGALYSFHIQGLPDKTSEWATNKRYECQTAPMYGKVSRSLFG